MSSDRIAEIREQLLKIASIVEHDSGNLTTPSYWRRAKRIAARVRVISAELEQAQQTLTSMGERLADTNLAFIGCEQRIEVLGTALDTAQQALVAHERVVGTCHVCHQPVEVHNRTIENRSDSPTWHTWCYYRDKLSASRAEVERLKGEHQEHVRAGYVLAMRLLQSHINLEDEERAAIDAFLPKRP